MAVYLNYEKQKELFNVCIQYLVQDIIAFKKIKKILKQYPWSSQSQDTLNLFILKIMQLNKIAEALTLPKIYEKVYALILSLVSNIRKKNPIITYDEILNIAVAELKESPVTELLKKSNQDFFNSFVNNDDIKEIQKEFEIYFDFREDLSKQNILEMQVFYQGLITKLSEKIKNIEKTKNEIVSYKTFLKKKSLNLM